MCERPAEIPFTLPPRFTTPNKCDLTEEEEIKTEARRDILAHRGSLSVSSRSSLPLFDSMWTWWTSRIILVLLGCKVRREKREKLLVKGVSVRVVPGWDGAGWSLLWSPSERGGGPPSGHGHPPLLLCGVPAQQRAAPGLLAPPRQPPSPLPWQRDAGGTPAAPRRPAPAPGQGPEHGSRPGVQRLLHFPGDVTG